jgi:hypothetical protein
MQSRTVKCLNLYFHARVDNGRPTAASPLTCPWNIDIGPRPLTRGGSSAQALTGKASAVAS